MCCNSCSCSAQNHKSSSSIKTRSSCSVSALAVFVILLLLFFPAGEQHSHSSGLPINQREGCGGGKYVPTATTDRIWLAGWLAVRPPVLINHRGTGCPFWNFLPITTRASTESQPHLHNPPTLAVESAQWILSTWIPDYRGSLYLQRSFLSVVPSLGGVPPPPPFAPPISH